VQVQDQTDTYRTRSGSAGQRMEEIRQMFVHRSNLFFKPSQNLCTPGGSGKASHYNIPSRRQRRERDHRFPQLQSEAIRFLALGQRGYSLLPLWPAKKKHLNDGYVPYLFLTYNVSSRPAKVNSIPCLLPDRHGWLFHDKHW